MEYLRDELLGAVDPAHRQRLLETSILNSLTGPLVDAVTGASGGEKWLRDTAAINQLLIGLDHTGTWFRYHHLFRDLLRLEAREAYPQRLAELHHRAAQWYESHADLGQAIIHLLAGGETREAAELLRRLGPQLLKVGQVATLRYLLDALGPVARTLTWCALLYGWCDYISDDYERSDGWLRTMVEVAPAGFDQTVAVSLRINIDLARGDVGTALAAAREMIATDQLTSRPCDLATATGAAYAWAGMADDARRILRFAAQKAAAEQFRTAHVLALVYLAITELDAGSAVTAQAAACTAVETAGRFGLAAYHGIAPAFAIRARTGTDPIHVHQDALLAVDLARRSSTDLALGYVPTACGDTLLDLQDPGGELLLAEARSVIARCPDPGIAGRYLARAEARRGLADAGHQPSAALLERLTDREIAVLSYLPTRMSQREISAELYVSLNTVKTHCRAIYRKLGVGDRKAAVQAARDAHLL